MQVCVDSHHEHSDQSPVHLAHVVPLNEAHRRESASPVVGASVVLPVVVTLLVESLLVSPTLVATNNAHTKAQTSVAILRKQTHT